MGHFWLDLYSHSRMNFTVPVIPYLCFMTQIHHGIVELFVAWHLAHTAISSVSDSSLESHVFAAYGHG
jgi:hypothetical protein